VSFLQLNTGTVFGKLITGIGNSVFGLVKPAAKIIAPAVLPGAGGLISTGIDYIDQQQQQKQKQNAAQSPSTQQTTFANNLQAQTPTTRYVPASGGSGSLGDWIKNNIQVVVASSVGLVLILILLFKK